MNAVVATPLVFTAEHYEAATRERIRRLKWLSADPKRWVDLRRYYRTHIADMINDWGITLDPRNAGRDVPVVMPFLLDAKQRDWVEFTFKNWRDREYALTEKSRDVGVSWLIVAFSVALCVLYDNVAIGWGSYVKQKLDFRGDMGSLFEKGRAYLEYLPPELRGGHQAAMHSFERRLLFPGTRSSIIGEIGDSIGRGARTSIYFVDEAAHLEHDQMVDMSLSKTTDVRQDVSSVRGMNNTFAQRAHKAGVRKFTFHWRENPRFTQADYDKFLDTWGPVVTAQELDINYQASLEGVVIPATWVNAAVDAHVKLKIKPTGEWRAALDVADQGIDKNALGIAHGVVLAHIEHWTGKESDIYATVEHAFLGCDGFKVRQLTYDADGLGAGVRGDARKVNEKRNPAFRINVKPFRGSAAVVDPTREMVEGRKNEDFFLNLKAQAWWWLRMRFQETYRAAKGEPYDRDLIISIPGDLPNKALLLIELSQPTYVQNPAGKLVINKQPENTPSPNLADAVMMLFAPGRKPLKIADSVLEE